jgi:hypothetical protein
MVMVIARRAVVFLFLTSQQKEKRKRLCDLSASAVKNK